MARDAYERQPTYVTRYTFEHQWRSYDDIQIIHSVSSIVRCTVIVYSTRTEGSIASKGNNLQIGRSECYENLSVASRCVASSTGLARQEYSLSFYTNVKRIRWEVWKHLMKRTREAHRRDGKRMTRRWRTVNGGWRTRRETARARRGAARRRQG